VASHGCSKLASCWSYFEERGFFVLRIGQRLNEPTGKQAIGDELNILPRSPVKPCDLGDRFCAILHENTEDPLPRSTWLVDFVGKANAA
jgi:hypothetical protein